jgi:hypothetical protein
MRDDQAFERSMQDWLADGSDRTPQPAIDAVLLAVRTTHQERDLRVPWRTQTMSAPLRLAAGIAIAVIIAVAGLSYLGQGSTAPGGLPPATSLSPAATSVPSPTPAASTSLLDTSAWRTYTSTQYGFSLRHPVGWTTDPADRAWDLETDAADWLSPAFDSFVAPEGDLRVSVWSTPVDLGMNVTDSWAGIEPWFTTYCENSGGLVCPTILDGAIHLCFERRDCHPGLLVGVVPPFDTDVQAFWYFDERMTVVTVWRAENDPSVARYGGARQLIEAFLSTMCVWPEDARPPFDQAVPGC